MDREEVVNGGVDMVENLVNGHVNGIVENGETNGIPIISEQNNVDGRIKKKARRLIKQLSKDGGVSNGLGTADVVAPRNWKNTRRPRNGYGRGLPKKGKDY